MGTLEDEGGQPRIWWPADTRKEGRQRQRSTHTLIERERDGERERERESLTVVDEYAVEDDERNVFKKEHKDTTELIECDEQVPTHRPHTQCIEIL